MVTQARLERMSRRLDFHGVPQLLWLDAVRNLDSCPSDSPRARGLLRNAPHGFTIVGVFTPGTTPAELARQVRGL